MKRLALFVLSIFVMGSMVPVDASLWSGTCTVSVTFSFDQPIRLALTNPDYEVALGDFADIDPLKSGMQGCAITLDALEPSRATGGSGSGSSTEFSCSATVASGSWTQGFVDGSGAQSPPEFSGTHTLTGTWNNWVLTIRSDSLNVVGVAHLTSPSASLSVDDCVLLGMNEITMVGQLVFQDP